MTHIVILGAGYAGTLAALRLAGKSPQAQITLINNRNTFVERIRLHQMATNQRLPVRSIPALLKGKHVTFLQGTATTLNPDERAIVVQTENGTQTVHYDILLYTLGSSIDRDSVPGVREHAQVLTPDGIAALQTAVENGARRLLVVGGGLTGIEASTEFAEMYPELQVTLVTREELGSALSQKARAYLKTVFGRLNITLRANIDVSRLNAGEAVLANGEKLAFDVCLWAGSFAVSSLARQAGVVVNERGQILIDREMRSLSHPDIYAAGDSAFCLEVPTRMACATAMPMASHAADNIARLLAEKPQKPFRFGYVGQCISLGRHNGVIQWVHYDDSPKEQIVTGRAAAFIKEMICRYTTISLAIERRLPGFYAWLQVEQGTKDAGYVRELQTAAVRNRLSNAR